MGVGAAILITALSVGLFSGLSCDTMKGARVDKVDNKTAENLCNSALVESLFTKDKQIAREYLCLCQQVAKKSDQNLCESVVNINNTIAIKEACNQPDPGLRRECLDLFRSRK